VLLSLYPYLPSREIKIPDEILLSSGISVKISDFIRV
jgi:hypothetical protein